MIAQISCFVFFACVLAQHALGQEVVLGMWALPEGRIVVSESENGWDATIDFHDGEVPIGFRRRTSATSLSRIAEVRDAEFVGAEMILTGNSSLYEYWRDGELVYTEEESSPVIGMVQVTHKDSSWAMWLQNEFLQAKFGDSVGGPFGLDDAEYPDHAVNVGEEWEVDSTTVVAIYGKVAAGTRPLLTVRLDSLGTYEGEPVAFLSQEVDIVISNGPEETFAMKMEARIIRSLEFMIDVLTVWQGEAISEHYGDEGLIVTSGFMHNVTRQRLVENATWPPEQ